MDLPKKIEKQVTAVMLDTQFKGFSNEALKLWGIFHL